MLKRIPEFFTSDWHLGHANAINFDERPFRDTDHMREVLVSNYNKTVPENGICYFLGDMGFGDKKEITETLKRLNGTKVLIIGNHDPKRLACFMLGWDLVLHNITLYIHGQKVTASHCPMMNTFREDTSSFKKHSGEPWHGHSKNKEYSVLDEGQFHLHGHIHSRQNKSSSVKILDRQYDVGVTANHYRPVCTGTIESWITKYKEQNIMEVIRDYK